MPEEVPKRLKKLFNQKTIGIKLERELGRGYWGITYLGTDKDGKKICIKTEKDFDRAKYEYQIIQDIYKDHTGKVIFDRKDKIHYFTMPFFEGMTLKKAMDQGLSLYEKVTIAKALKKEMKFVFSKGYLHRDIHNLNILYNPKNKDKPVNIIDFGRGVKDGLDNKAKQLNHYSARLFFQPQTAPEYVFRGDIGKHSDVFSFGLIMNRFFPGEGNDIAALAYRLDTKARTDAFDKLDDTLEQVFARQKNILTAECQKLIDSPKYSSQRSKLELLKNALKASDLNNAESLSSLQSICQNTFDDFKDIKPLHWFVFMVYSLLTTFGFVQEKDLLKYEVRAFMHPEPKDQDKSDEELDSSALNDGVKLD